jgi:outer membrane beta-barrel protein
MKLPRLKMMPGLLAALAALLICTSSREARADEDQDADQVATYAVQRRLFRLGLELTAGVGILPMDAFSKVFVADGAVTWHFSSAWGWEIVQGGYGFLKTSTGLKKELLNNFGVEPTQLPIADFLVSSNLVFTPFYGKLAGLNRSVNHVEIFFPFGIALGHYTNPASFREGLDVGLGLRWFLGSHTSLRVDARDYIVVPGLSDLTLTNEILFALGLSVAWGGAEQ